MALLTLDELKSATPVGSVSDTVLQMLLDAAENALTNRWGSPTGAYTERHRGGSRLIVLRRPVLSVTSVTEIYGTSTSLLASGDFFLRASGMSLLRLPGGRYWGGAVEVVSTPRDDTPERKRIQLALVKLELSYSGGLTSQRIGDYAESKDPGASYSLERAAILDSYSLPRVP